MKTDLSARLDWGCTAENNHLLSQILYDRYRCPQDLFDFVLSGQLSSSESFFRFGPAATCFGRSCLREPGIEYDSLNNTQTHGAKISLPFNPSEIVENLMRERYANYETQQSDDLFRSVLRKLYYFLRPSMTLAVRRTIQKFYARTGRKLSFPRWPVDTTVEDICENLLLLTMHAKGVDKIPFVWFWPKGASACVIMTHDVETEAGRDRSADLMDLDDSFGIKASFQIVPEERYTVPSDLLAAIRDRGFEIVIQDLNHDGRLFDDKAEFLRRVKLINRYGQEFGARGFRAAVLYRRPEWYDALEFAFDMSIPNVAHLDPQRGGCCTVMPYFIGNILELPVTTTQDYTLFHILNDYSIGLWKTQLGLILRKNGMASFIIHPDYVIEPKAFRVYQDLLRYLQEIRKETPIWCALPSEVDSWWRNRSKMFLVEDGEGWRIEGPGAERAVVAYAKNVDGSLVYEVA